MTTMTSAGPLYRTLRAHITRLADEHELKKILELAFGAGVSLPGEFAARLDEIKATRKTANQVDPDLPPAERRHRSRQILQRADSLEAGARKLLDGPKIEAAAKRIVAGAVRELTKVDLDPGIVTVEDAARAGGGAMVDKFLKVEALENRINAVWDLMLLLRRVCVLAPTITRANRDRFSPVVPYTPTGTRDGWIVDEPHRFDSRLGDAAKLGIRGAIHVGVRPGVYDADEARAHLASYMAEAMSDQPPIPSGGRIL